VREKPAAVIVSGKAATPEVGYVRIASFREGVVDQLKKQIADKGMPSGSALLTSSATPRPRVEDGKIRNCFGANFVEVEVDTELGAVKILKFVAVHESGRIMNPLTAASQVKGGVAMGVGMALHENMIYDQRTGRPVVTGYYFDRVVTHLDAPDVQVEFIEADDGYGPYGARALGRLG